VLEELEEDEPPPQPVIKIKVNPRKACVTDAMMKLESDARD
jgi:hypothetical protein